MIRQDCIPSNLIHIITDIGEENIVSITTNKDPMREALCMLTGTTYNNRPESFTIMYQGTEEQEAEYSKVLESIRRHK